VQARRRTQDLEGPQVRAFAQQPGIHLAQHRAEAVGVVEQRSLAIGPDHLQPVVDAAGQRALEQPGGIARLQRGQPFATAGGHGHHLRGAGQEGRQPGVARGSRMQPEHAEGIGVPALAQQLDVAFVQHQA
jgi:hypothetical protein